MYARPSPVVPYPAFVGTGHRLNAEHGAANAGFVGVPADLTVTAYQSASGLMNLFIPTSVGGLAIARVPYVRYLRWVWTLVALLAGLTVALLAVGTLAG